MSETIHVKLPDGSVKDVPRGTSALDIAKSISPRLADAALVAQVKPLSSNGAAATATIRLPSQPEPTDEASRRAAAAKNDAPAWSTSRVRWRAMPSCAS